MKNIKKDKFLLWLIWVVPISLCGIQWALVWTVVQIISYQSYKKENEKRKVPLWEDQEIIEMNKGIKLDENYNGLIKTGEGSYFYQRKR